MDMAFLRRAERMLDERAAAPLDHALLRRGAGGAAGGERRPRSAAGRAVRTAAPARTTR